MGLGRNWGGNDEARVTTEALDGAAHIGKNLLLELNYPIKSVGLTPTHEGGLLFSLFGPEGRSVDLWIDPGDGAGLAVLDPGYPHHEDKMIEVPLKGYDVTPVVEFIETGWMPR
jgi:hypothetical protein